MYANYLRLSLRAYIAGSRHVPMVEALRVKTNLYDNYIHEINIYHQQVRLTINQNLVFIISIAWLSSYSAFTKQEHMQKFLKNIWYILWIIVSLCNKNSEMGVELTELILQLQVCKSTQFATCRSICYTIIGLHPFYAHYNKAWILI